MQEGGRDLTASALFSYLELALPQALAAPLSVGASRRREYYILFVIGVSFFEHRLRGQAQYLLALVVHENLCAGLEGSGRLRKRGTPAGTALQLVESFVVDDQVVCALAGYEVLVAVLGLDAVGAPTRLEGVRAGAAVDDVVAALAVDQVWPVATAHLVPDTGLVAPVHEVPIIVAVHQVGAAFAVLPVDVWGAVEGIALVRALTDSAGGGGAVYRGGQRHPASH